MLYLGARSHLIAYVCCFTNERAFRRDCSLLLRLLRPCPSLFQHILSAFICFIFPEYPTTRALCYAYQVHASLMSAKVHKSPIARAVRTPTILDHRRPHPSIPNLLLSKSSHLLTITYCLEYGAHIRKRSRTVVRRRDRPKHGTGERHGPARSRSTSRLILSSSVLFLDHRTHKYGT